MPIPVITSLEQLQYNLNLGPGNDGYKELINAVEFPEEEIEKMCLWNSDRYTRICIYDTPELEAMVTCWQPGQASGIRNDDFNHGWVKVLKGDLWLEIFRLKEEKTDCLTEVSIPGKSILHLHDSLGYHRFFNHSGKKAIALFFYACKLTHWNAFDETEGVFEEVKPAYDRNLDQDKDH